MSDECPLCDKELGKDPVKIDAEVDDGVEEVMVCQKCGKKVLMNFILNIEAKE
jgi:DNA-directed RNA polymerase subunit RPC12/RpoP